MMDADLLAAGADYDDLNKTIIIFICPFDPFDEGRYIYTFENLCLENKDLRLKDGATKIFLNTKGVIGDVDAEIIAFLQYVDGVVSDNSLVQEIEQEIQKVKSEEQERVSYMTFAMKMMEERKEGFREGKLEGKLEGKAETQQMMLQIFPLLRANVPLPEISKRTGCTMEYLLQLQAVMQ